MNIAEKWLLVALVIWAAVVTYKIVKLEENAVRYDKLELKSTEHETLEGIEEAEKEEYCEYKWDKEHTEIRCGCDIKITYGDGDFDFTFCPHCGKKIKVVEG